MKALILALLVSSCPHYWHHSKVIYMKDYYNGGPVTVDTLKEVLVYKREVFVPDSLIFLQTYTTRCDSCGYVEIIKKVWIKPNAILKQIKITE